MFLPIVFEYFVFLAFNLGKYIVLIFDFEINRFSNLLTFKDNQFLDKIRA